MPNHHQPLTRERREEACQAEQELRRDEDATLKEYLNGLKKRVRGRGAKQCQRLLDLKQTYPEDAFINAIKHAEHYGLYDLNRLEDIILKHIAGIFFELEGEEE